MAHVNRTEMFRSVEMYYILMKAFSPLFIQNNECTWLIVHKKVKT